MNQFNLPTYTYIFFYFSFQQTVIIARNYSYDLNWAEILYNQYIINNRIEYFQEFLIKFDSIENVAENIVKMVQAENIKLSVESEQAVVNVIQNISSVILKYKLASLLGLKKIIADLINDQSLYYLKDTDYGRQKI